MLGEKLADYQGKITGRRILPSDGTTAKIETSFEVSGKIMGIDSTMMGTYWSTVKPDGFLYGECPWQGVLMTLDGDMATWGGAGAGRFTGQGSGVSFRGAVYYQTSSPKLARLNGMAVVYEWEMDGNGDGKVSLWEWK